MNKQIFNGEPFCILTHADLDGAASYIVLKEHFKGQVTQFKVTGYPRISENLTKLSFFAHNLIITDLSLTPEDLDIAESLFEKIYIIDHHVATAENIKNRKKVTSTFSTKYCGAVLAYSVARKYGL